MNMHRGVTCNCIGYLYIPSFYSPRGRQTTAWLPLEMARERHTPTGAASSIERWWSLRWRKRPVSVLRWEPPDCPPPSLDGKMVKPSCSSCCCVDPIPWQEIKSAKIGERLEEEKVAKKHVSIQNSRPKLNDFHFSEATYLDIYAIDICVSSVAFREKHSLFSENVNKDFELLSGFFCIFTQIDDCRDLSSLYYLLPFQRGYLVNWDHQKTIWDYLFGKTCFNIETSGIGSTSLRFLIKYGSFINDW